MMSRYSTPPHNSGQPSSENLGSQIDSILEENGIISARAAAPEKPGLSISRLMEQAGQKIPLLGLFVVIALVWAAAYHLFAYVPVYQSHAKVIIKDSAINTRYVEEEQFYKLKTTSSNNASPVLNTMQLIYSHTVSEHFYNFLKEKHPDVLKESDIKDLKDWNKFYKNGEDFVAVKNIPGTDIIDIDFAWSDPTLAKEGLAEIITGFQNASRLVNKAEEVDRYKYLKAKIDELTQKLITIRIEKGKHQKKSLSLDTGSEGNTLSGNRLSLKIKLNNLQALKAGKQAESARYQKLLGLNPEEAFVAASIATNSNIVSEKTKLYALQEQYAKLNSFYTEKSPQVKEVKSQMEQVKANIAQEIRRSFGNKYSDNLLEKLMITDSSRATLMQQMIQAEADVARMGKEIRVIQEGLTEIEDRIQEIPGISKTLLELQEQEDTLSKGLNALRQKQLEATLRESQTLSNVFVADEPSAPITAEFPRPIHLYPLACLLAVMVWLGVLVAQDQFGELPLVQTISSKSRGFIKSRRSQRGSVNTDVAKKLFKTLKHQRQFLV